MKPYYEQDGITIYNCDCREVLPTIEAGSVDLVLTDPPYGINYHSGRYVGGNPHEPIQGDDRYPIDVIEACRALARVAVLAFLRWDVLPQLPAPDSLIAWVKNNWSAGDLEHGYAKQWEAVAVWNGAEHAWRNGRPADVVSYDRVPAPSLGHPTEKPVGLLQVLLKHNVGDIVLDPFMGVGTTIEAAKLNGHQAIGIEIEERYCEIAANRLAQGVLDFNEPEAATA